LLLLFALFAMWKALFYGSYEEAAEITAGLREFVCCFIKAACRSQDKFAALLDCHTASDTERTDQG
jgi:hypothetical protein